MKHHTPGVDQEKLRRAQKLMAEAFGEDSEEALHYSADRFARWQKSALSDPREAYDARNVKLFPVQDANHVRLVTVKATAFSACEHHYAPAWLKVTIGYSPDRYFVGYSKVVKMFRHFACKYTMDERLCNDFIAEFVEQVRPTGVGLILRGRHFCVISRGGHENDTPTISAMQGALATDDDLRRELVQHAFSSWENGT